MRELDFVGKLFQQNALTRIREHLSGTNYAPLVVELDLTTFCNIKCPECVNRALLNKDEFSKDRLFEILQDMKHSGVRNIILIGGGEPLLYPYLEETLAFCHSLGFDIGLVTNGVLLGAHAEIINDTVKWVRISVDAATPDTYFRCKGINAFDTVINGITKLCGNKKPKVGFSFLIGSTEGNSCNIHELNDAAHLAESIGCDYFELKPMVDQQHFLCCYNTRMLTMINEFIEKSSRLNIPVIYPKSIDHLLKGGGEQQKTYHACLIARYRTLLTPYGVFPCPYKRGVTEKKACNIDMNRSFWETRDRIQRIDACLDPSVDCRFFCIRNESNLLLHTIYELYNSKIDLLQHFKTYDTNDLFI